MSEEGTRTKPAAKDPSALSGPEALDPLIRGLKSGDGLARQRARESLVALEGPAVPPLLEMLTDRRKQVRWEAVKALAEIADPATAPALLAALEDEDPGVRWIAGEGLIALRRAGLLPLLHALTQKADSIWLRQGAHQVLRALAGERLGEVVAPVLRALEEPDPAVQVPPAAFDALSRLGETASSRP